MRLFRSKPSRVFWLTGLALGIVITGVGVLGAQINDLLDFESHTEPQSQPDQVVGVSTPGKKAAPGSWEARLEFISELRTILDNQGDGSAPAISELCRRADREITPKMRFSLDRMTILNNDGDLSVDLRILMYRNAGLPESFILEELAKHEAVSIGQTKEASAIDVALVRAARSLVAAPVIRPAATKAR